MKLFLTVLVLFALSACTCQKPIEAGEATFTSWDQRARMGEPAGRSGGTLITITANVQSVDRSQRRVTLIPPNGQPLTVKVGKDIELDRIKSGDRVKVDYLQSVAFEVRPPTAAEKAHPLTVTTRATTGQGMEAARGIGEQIHAIVTVTGIDRTAQTVTVRLPDGSTTTIKANYPEILERTRIGDTAAVTYTEAVALQVNPTTA